MMSAAQGIARQPAPRAGAPLAPAQRAMLEQLRACARVAQRGARLDLDRGCAIMNPGATGTAFAIALLRALDVAALRPLAFHPRGASAVAFGEAWTLALIGALRDGDLASAQFLVRSRVRREARRQVLWLAGRVAAAAGAGQGDAADLEWFQESQPQASRRHHPHKEPT